jgi:hypothetical protein
MFENLPMSLVGYSGDFQASGTLAMTARSTPPKSD